MASLTFEEFMKLSEGEKCERYVELSNHDKFLARISAPVGFTKIDAGQKSLPEAEKKRKMTKEEVEKWAHRMGVYDRNVLSMLDPDEWRGYDVYMMLYTDRELCISGHVIMVKGDEIRLASDEELIELIKDDMFGYCAVDDPWEINIGVEELESKIEPGARVSDTAGSAISVSRRSKKSRISLATAKQIMNSIPVDVLINFPHPGEKLAISYSREDENYYIFDIFAIPEFMELENMTDAQKDEYCVIPWRVDKRTGWAEEWVE